MTSIREKFLLYLLVLSIGGCASLPRDIDRHPSFLTTETGDTRLGRVISPMVKEHPGESGFYVLNEGLEAFLIRIALVSRAEKTIDLQYYIWHNDLTGRVLHNRLLEAADRGVRIRLLLDDLDTANKDELLHIINAHPNIEIRLYNPFANRNFRIADFLTDTRRINRRMHNKTFTADNQATILGGRNIGDEYFDATEDVGFSDMDVLAIGPVVTEVSQSFDNYWNSPWVYPLAEFRKEVVATDAIKAFHRESNVFLETASSSDYADALRSLDINRLGSFAELDYSWGKWMLVYDQPSKVEAKIINNETHLAPRLKEGIDVVRNDLIIVSPYFVPGPNFTSYLVNRVEQGVRVRIMTNSLASNDVPMVHAGYMRYREDLIKGGVELYEFKPVKGVSEDREETHAKWSGSSRASLHGKFLGFDRRYVFIGSFNLDARSVALNSEIGVYFESPRYAERLADRFDQIAIKKGYRVLLSEQGALQWVTLENGERITINTEPETSLWRRFNTRFLSIFVPESQL